MIHVIGGSARDKGNGVGQNGPVWQNSIFQSFLDFTLPKNEDYTSDEFSNEKKKKNYSHMDFKLILS